MKRVTSSSVNRNIRPSRWAWRLDGLEMSRACITETWQRMKDAAHIVPGSVYFHEGKGCTTSRRFGARDGREVLTLRELLAVARVDYVSPVVEK